MHDYILILYEYNPQTELYLTARAMRIKIFLDDKLKSTDMSKVKFDGTEKFKF